MAPPVEYPLRMYQKFTREDGSQIPGLLTSVCSESGRHYLFWADIKESIMGISYLLNTSGSRALFMIDKSEELYFPLRIEHNPDGAYIVIYDSTSTTGMRSDNSSMDTERLAPIAQLFDSTGLLYRQLKDNVDKSRTIFQQYAANIRYHHSLLAKEIEMLDQAETKAMFGKDRGQVLEELHNLEQQVPDLDYRNACRNTLQRTDSRWDYATSNLFIVLPSDLDTWNDSDPSTHQVRLHFLCDTGIPYGALKGIPQYVHLSNHPGYKLKKPQEFFSVYGDYVLRVMKLIKHGYSNEVNEIRPLETSLIMLGCDSDVVGHIDEDTIGFLVDKTITYLQKLSPPKWTADIGLNRAQSSAIQDFLDLEDSSDAQGDLHRYIDSDQRTFWMCPLHISQFFPHGSLKTLKEFVHDRGGLVNMQKATLRVELSSPSEADQFRILLRGTSHIFDISIKLLWQATSSYVEAFCEDIAKSKAVVLELDGITLDIQPLDYVQSLRNHFADHNISGPGLKFVTLLNYPQPQEQCIYLRQFSLQSKLTPAISTHSWSALRSDLGNAVQLEYSDSHTTAKALRSALKSYGISDATTVTIHGSNWNGIFDLQKGSFSEAQSQDLACPDTILSSGTLRRLTLDLCDVDFDQNLVRMVQINSELQDLNVSCHRKNIFQHIKLVAKMWYGTTQPIRLTLLDRTADTQGRIISQLTIQGRESGLTGGTTWDTQEQNPNQMRLQQHLGFLQWNCDHIFSQLNDPAVSILNMATRQHPSVLTFFTLDISQLSYVGLVSVQSVLKRSPLEHLNIMCTAFAAKLSDSIAHVLDSVPWLTLKSLVLSGDNIDEWLQLWPSTTAARLLYLALKGPGSKVQELTHLGALFIHQLAYTSPLVELALENVQFEDSHDWNLIVENLDPSVNTECSFPRQ